MKNKWIIIVTGLTVLFIMVGFIFGNISEETSRQYYVREMKVCEASVVETQLEDNKYYVRVIPGGDAAYVNAVAEDLWTEVTEPFYNQVQSNGTVGVLLSNVDIYKVKYLGLLGKKGQKYERESWNVEEIYPSYADAQAANPVKQYLKDGLVKKKKILKSGDRYLVLEAEGRTFSTKVSSEFYDQSPVGAKVKAEFESIGEVVKLNRIVESN